LRDVSLGAYHNWGLATGSLEGPPRESPEIQVDITQITIDQVLDNPTASTNDRADECVAHVTAHELSHGVYVTHHFPSTGGGATNCIMRYTFNEINLHKKSVNDDAPAWAVMVIPDDLDNLAPDNCRSEVQVSDTP